jgi:hypothetical protein
MPAAAPIGVSFGHKAVTSSAKRQPDFIFIETATPHGVGRARRSRGGGSAALSAAMGFGC